MLASTLIPIVVFVFVCAAIGLVAFAWRRKYTATQNGTTSPPRDDPFATRRTNGLALAAVIIVCLAAIAVLISFGATKQDRTLQTLANTVGRSNDSRTSYDEIAEREAEVGNAKEKIARLIVVLEHSNSALSQGLHEQGRNLLLFLLRSQVELTVYNLPIRLQHLNEDIDFNDRELARIILEMNVLLSGSRAEKIKQEARNAYLVNAHERESRLRGDSPRETQERVAHARKELQEIVIEHEKHLRRLENDIREYSRLRSEIIRIGRFDVPK